jgi:hypothetical protein
MVYSKLQETPEAMAFCTDDTHGRIVGKTTSGPWLHIAAEPHANCSREHRDTLKQLRSAMRGPNVASLFGKEIGVVVLRTLPDTIEATFCERPEHLEPPDVNTPNRWMVCLRLNNR